MVQMEVTLTKNLLPESLVLLEASEERHFDFPLFIGWGR